MEGEKGELFHIIAVQNAARKSWILQFLVPYNWNLFSYQEKHVPNDWVFCIPNSIIYEFFFFILVNLQVVFCLIHVYGHYELKYIVLDMFEY